MVFKIMFLVFLDKTVSNFHTGHLLVNLTDFVISVHPIFVLCNCYFGRLGLLPHDLYLVRDGNPMSPHPHANTRSHHCMLMHSD